MADIPAAVVHIPHSAIEIPPEWGSQFILTPSELNHEILWMTDRYADELFAQPQSMATTIRFSVSRLVVDPERFEDDSREPMATRGMGVVYTKTSDGRPLRRPLTRGERTALIDAYYLPHHERLARAVDEALAAHGHCLIIDAHSCASRPLPYEPDQRSDRPEICIGTDVFHTPGRLIEEAVAQFRARFGSVEVNRPYAGTIVPARYFQKDRRVQSIMIEINRSLYMDEWTGEKTADFQHVARGIQEALVALINP